MSRTAKTVFCVLGLVAALAVAGMWWLASSQPAVSTLAAEGEVPDPAAEQVAKIAASTIARIEAESVHGNAPTPVEVVAAPGVTAADAAATKAAASPPDGFDFTAFDGPMAKGRMTTLDFAEAPDPVGELPWLATGGIDGLLAQAAIAGREWTFGWVAVAADADPASIGQRLRAAGAEVLGRSGSLLRMRLPADRGRLDEIAGLPGVAGIAPTPPESKLAAPRDPNGDFPSADGMVPTFVTLMSGDPDGQWREALAALGGVVGAFDPSIRAYAANFPRAVLETVAAADFVLSVEPVGRVESTHASAVPAMGADALRMYDQGSGLFSGIGGAAVPIGVMDSGLNIRHEDIGTGRRSICGANFATLPSFFDTDRAEDQDLWVDAGLHGTHVTGTIVGNGTGDPQHAGMAPLVQDIRFAKVLSSSGFGSLLGAVRAMDFLAESSTCEPAGTPSVRPYLVNVSLGANGYEWEGRSAGERKLDATVWNARQLYVVAQSNSAFEFYGDLPSAKNALAVGAVVDGGDLANFSSHGPTADGRLKPQVVGAGVRVLSARGDGRRSGYVGFSGTSMASPAVAGVAALLMDAVPEFREQPAAVRARLMASAIRPDAFLDDLAGFPLHNGNGPGALQHRYGLGKVSARTSVLNRDQADGWVSGSAIIDLADGEYGYRDIEVPEGTSRLDIVMTWDERAADGIASAVVNDLDLWVDRDADCPASQPAACGNAASRSSRDNVEWLILRDPVPGTYRLKVVPKYARVDAPRAGLAWTVIRGPPTPQLAIMPASAAVAVAPGEAIEVEATLTTDGYVAAGTTLRVDCREDADVEAADGAGICERIELLAPKASEASREDAVTRTLADESGDAIALGELAVGEEQTVRLMFKQHPDAARFRLYLTATAWNATAASTSVDVTIGTSDADAVPAASLPANDSFANAAVLDGDVGSVAFDMLLATPEPGEAPFAQRIVDDFYRYESQRRPRSLWYRWLARSDGIVRFSIPGEGDGLAEDVQLDVFAVRGRSMAELDHIAAKFGGGLTFGARRGTTYAIRLGITHYQLFEYAEDSRFGRFPADFLAPLRRRPVVPLSLHWQPATLPPNDDFELATAIAGETGEQAGSNLTATEQPGERLQPLSASTWYRWTAPGDGDFEFGVDRRHLKVAAFTGEAVDDLRLVSGLPGEAATFPARAGESYMVVVAADDAYASGSDYTLSWAPGVRAGGNDDMANAVPIIGAPSFFHFGFADLVNGTVEPGEPRESGVRTAWWTWTAPLTARYTWRASSPFEDALAVSVVEVGETLMPLDASAGEHQTEQLLSFDGVAGRQYLISAGLPATQPFTVSFNSPITFEWGPAPVNDELATAGSLAGVSGTVVGSNRFATVAAGEATGLLGDSSVWWTWEVPESHWYRLALEDQSGAGVVSVYNVDDGGALSHEPVAVSRRLPDPILVFRADAGERYAVRVGSDGSWSGTEFALNWAPNGAPTWLRYVSSATDGDLDDAGNILDLASPDSVAIHPDGGELYAATASGLQVFSRDAGTGLLTHGQTLAGIDERAELFWDPGTGSGIGVGCAGVSRFPSMEGGGLGAPVPVAGAVPCLGGALPSGTLLHDSTGTFAYFFSQFGIFILQFDAERTAVGLVGGLPIGGLSAAVFGKAEDFVYAAGFEGLQVFARDPASGALLPVTLEGDNPAAELGSLNALALDDDGRYLFGVTQDRGVAAFDLAEPAAPVFVAEDAGLRADVDFGDPFGPEVGPGVGIIYYGESGCAFAGARTRTRTVDVLCDDVALSRRLLPGAPAVRQEDLLQPGGVDAFDNNLPYTGFSRGVAASPDGRHIYASASRGIMIFERAGSR